MSRITIFPEESANTYDFPGVPVTNIDNDVHVRRPESELSLPGIEGGERQHQQIWTVHLVRVEQVVHK